MKWLALDAHSIFLSMKYYYKIFQETKCPNQLVKVYLNSWRTQILNVHNHYNICPSPDDCVVLWCFGISRFLVENWKRLCLRSFFEFLPWEFLSLSPYSTCNWATCIRAFTISTLLKFFWKIMNYRIVSSGFLQWYLETLKVSISESLLQFHRSFYIFCTVEVFVDKCELKGLYRIDIRENLDSPEGC